LEQSYYLFRLPIWLELIMKVIFYRKSFVFLNLSGHPKINELDLVFSVFDHDILALEIRMNHALIMDLD